MTTDTIGPTVSTKSPNIGAIITQPLVASASGVLTSVGISVNTNGPDTVTVGIYSDNGGTPDALLGYSNTITTVVGWNDIAIIGTVNIVTGTTYWLSIQFVSGTNLYDSASGAYDYDGPIVFNVWPAVFNVVGNDGPNSTLVMRMTYSSTPPAASALLWF